MVRSASDEDTRHHAGAALPDCTCTSTVSGEHSLSLRSVNDQLLPPLPCTVLRTHWATARSTGLCARLSCPAGTVKWEEILRRD
jgi:hypothetical protein